MAYCSKCGKHMEDGAAFCTNCGAPLQNQAAHTESNVDAPKKTGLGIVALVLGITGLLAWIIPIIGIPVGVAALVLGILGIKKSSRGMSIAGLVLGVICIILAVINGAVGAFLVFNSEAGIQKNIEENVTEDYLYENQEQYVFTLRDSEGNILMTGGIESTGIDSMASEDGSKRFVVLIKFNSEASEKFAEITKDNFGRQVGIYLNDDMVANPTVNEAITSGKCQIAVDTYEEAQKLEALLKKSK